MNFSYTHLKLLAAVLLLLPCLLQSFSSKDVLESSFFTGLSLVLCILLGSTMTGNSIRESKEEVSNITDSNQQP